MFILRYRPAFADGDFVSDFRSVFRIVDFVFLGLLVIFLILRMLDEPRDRNHDRLVHLVGNDNAAQGLGVGLLSCSFRLGFHKLV